MKSPSISAGGRFLICGMMLVSIIVSASAGTFKIKGPKSPKPWEATAVQELTEYLSRRVQPADKVTVGGRSAVTFHVGDTPFAAMKGLSSKKMDEEMWTIRSFGGDVVLNGGGTRGCLYAVYHFLEDYCGVRWWSEKEEDILDSGALVLPKLNVKEKPAMFYRNIIHTWAKNEEIVRHFARRRLNRHPSVVIPPALGGSVEFGPPKCCHTFNKYVPIEKYGKTHPEYFTFRNGKRAESIDFTQLCLSNPDVYKMLRDGLLANVAQGEKEAAEKGIPAPVFYDVSVNDNDYFCECPKCKAESDKYGESGFCLKVINSLAAEVAKKYPKVYILTYAYACTRKPPKCKIKAAPNVIIMYCPLEANFAVSVMDPKDKDNAKVREYCSQWSKFADNLLIWDYAITFGRDTLGYPLPNEWYFGEKYRFYHENNVRGISWEQEWVHLSDLFDVKFYLMTKLAENPTLDYPALMKRTFSEFFGPKAGPLVYQARERLREAQQRSEVRIGWMPSVFTFNFITGEDAEVISALYDKAEKAAAGDARHLRRIKRARSGHDRLVARRKNMLVRGELDGKPCWMANAEVFGTPHRKKAYPVTDKDSPTGKAVELGKYPGHGSPLQILYNNPVKKKNPLAKNLVIPADAHKYTWYDLGRVTIEKDSRFLMTTSYLAQVYTPNEGELVGKTFDVKLLARMMPNGQIRLGRMAFVEVGKE